MRLEQDLRSSFDIDVRVLGLISSQKMLLSDSALELDSWKQRFDMCA